MGFIPIFLTLGASIFLFAMVVHQNLKQKKLLLKAELVNIALLIDRILEKDKNGFNTPEVLTIKDAEELLKSVIRNKEDLESQQQINTIHQKLNTIKRVRHDYNKLIETKPYYFVAVLFGHQLI